MNTMKRGSIFLMAIICVFFFMSTGCGKKTSEDIAVKTAEKAIEKSLASEGKQADVTIDADTQSFSMTVSDDEGQQTMEMKMGEEDASMVITGEDGTVAVATGAAAGIPEGFPEDVPLHSSLKVNMSMNNGSAGFTLQTTSTEKFEELVRYCKEESVKLGWKEQMNMQQNPDAPMQMMVYEKADRILNFIIQQEEDAVSVTISVSTQQ